MSKNPYYYSDGPYLRALQSLHYALVKSESFIQFMGAPKSGKTTLCDKLALYMERKGHEVFFIDKPLDSPEMVRSVLAQKFNLPNSNNFARLLEDSLAQAEAKTRVLIFDDAHLLSDITLIEIHRLMEIQANSKRLLNIVLCGDLQLERRFTSKAEFKSLALNVSHKFLLGQMTQAEVGQFVAGFLAHDGVPETPISAAALELLSRTTKGFPAPAILVAQIIADGRQNSSIASELGKEELAQLIKASNIQSALPTSQVFDAGQLKVIAPIAAVFAIAVLGFLFQVIFDRPATVPDSDAAIESVATADVPAEAANSPFVAAAEPESEETPDVQVEPVADNEPAEEPSASALTNATPAEQPIMPSLLRPAPTFSLDEEEPVSDSSLSLVTAAEIGVTGELLQIPEFAELVAIEAEQETSTAATADAALLRELGDSANATASPAPEIVQSPANLAESIVDAEPAVDEISSPVAESTSPPIELSEQGAMTVATSDEPSSVSSPQANTQSTTSSTSTVATQTYRESIDAWLSAWADQDMESYFGSYDESFEPRYDDSVSRWRRNRERVITNAGSINLSLSEFSIVAEEPDAVEVNFWLDYESPTYRDSTLKKLVLTNDSGRWLIAEEVNLQVRP